MGFFFAVKIALVWVMQKQTALLRQSSLRCGTRMAAYFSHDLNRLRVGGVIKQRNKVMKIS